MPTDKPLAVSERIASLSCDIYDAGITRTPEWKEKLTLAVDAEIRPLVEVLDRFCGDTEIYAVSRKMKEMFPSSWEIGAGTLINARDGIKAP